ncbi:MAG: response regulator [Anaerolineales bacterium]|nr:response regulator [Anaerolineales bacterium]
MPEVAGNGEEAIQSLRRQSYNVILMDVQMPILDGVTATKRIRSELPAIHQPYIIAMTAPAMESDERQFRAAGMDDYVTKPVVAESWWQHWNALRVWKLTFSDKLLTLRCPYPRL